MILMMVFFTLDKNIEFTWITWIEIDNFERLMVCDRLIVMCWFSIDISWSDIAHHDIVRIHRDESIAGELCRLIGPISSFTCAPHSCPIERLGYLDLDLKPIDLNMMISGFNSPGPHHFDVSIEISRVGVLNFELVIRYLVRALDRFQRADPMMIQYVSWPLKHGQYRDVIEMRIKLL